MESSAITPMTPANEETLPSRDRSYVSPEPEAEPADLQLEISIRIEQNTESAPDSRWLNDIAEVRMILGSQCYIERHISRCTEAATRLSKQEIRSLQRLRPFNSSLNFVGCALRACLVHIGEETSPPRASRSLVATIRTNIAEQPRLLVTQPLHAQPSQRHRGVPSLRGLRHASTERLLLVYGQAARIVDQFPELVNVIRLYLHPAFRTLCGIRLRSNQDIEQMRHDLEQLKMFHRAGLTTLVIAIAGKIFPETAVLYAGSEALIHPRPFTRQASSGELAWSWAIVHATMLNVVDEARRQGQFDHPADLRLVELLRSRFLDGVLDSDEWVLPSPNERECDQWAILYSRESDDLGQSVHIHCGPRVDKGSWSTEVDDDVDTTNERLSLGRQSSCVTLLQYLSRLMGSGNRGNVPEESVLCAWRRAYRYSEARNPLLLSADDGDE